MMALHPYGRFVSIGKGILNTFTDPSWENAASIGSLGLAHKAWRPKNGKTWGPDIQWADSKIKSKIRYSSELTDSDEEMLEPITGGDCIFSDVYSRGNKGETTEEGFLLKATAEVSSEFSLTGGQAVKLETLWNLKAAPQAAEYPISLPAPNIGNCKDRQEVVLVHEMLYPQGIDSVPDKSREVHVDRKKLNGQHTHYKKYHRHGFTGQYWTMDFYIEELDFTYNAAYPHGNDGPVGSIDNSAWLRGMAVTFSNTKPQANETFYDFVARCTAPGIMKEGTYKYAAKHLREYNNDTKTFMGFYIGKFNWDGTDIDTEINKEHQKFSDDPILCIPFLQSWTDSQTTDLDIQGTSNKTADASISGPGWRTGNLAHGTDHSSTSKKRFHQRIGDTVWFYPGTGSGAYTKGMSDNCIELSESRWYRAAVNFHAVEGAVLTFFDANNNEELTIPIRLTTPNRATIAGTSVDDYPKYVSIWLNNYPGGRKGKSCEDHSHGAESEQWTSRTWVYVD